MEKRTQNTSNMKLIIQMSLPAIFSMFISALYNIVDSIFVAQLGEYALAAVSLVFPIQTLIIAVGVGTGVGLSTLLAIKLGEKDQGYATEIANYTITLGVIIGILFALFGLLFNEPFFRLFTSDPQVYESGVAYANIITFFSAAQATQLLMEKTFQGTGDMITPMITVLIGSITNIILDPILIFGLLGAPALGVKGAAIATVVGQVLSMTISLILFYRKDIGLKIQKPVLKLEADKLRDIMSVGFPSILKQGLASVLVFILNGVVSLYSDIGVLVLGIYFRLQQFVFMPVHGISQGVRPIQAYFFGAQEGVNLKDTFKKANVLTRIIMLSGTLIFIVFAPQILQAFNPSTETFHAGVQALRIISISFLFAGRNMMYSTFFLSINKGKTSFYISFLRELSIIILLALVLGYFWGLTGVWLAFPITELATVLITRFVFMNRSNVEVLQ